MAGSTRNNRPSLGGATSLVQLALPEETRLGMVWEAHMKNSQSFVRYQETAVLLFYWEGSDLDRNRTLRREVEDLARVFRDEYRFKVEVRLLDHEKPQQQMNVILSTFMLHHDNPNTLSIIYYAGHGVSKDGDNLVLLRSTNTDAVMKEHLKPNSIAWNAAETLLRDRKGDVFAIFDCCDAGSICHPRGPLRFEVLGACCYEQTTSPPGSTSFTTALIWALRQLKDSPKGFFSSVELQHKIKQYKDFPKDQIPHLSHRELESAGLDHIVLAPLNPDSSPLDQKEQHIPPRVDSHFLDLRFHFHGNITDEIVKNLATNLRPLVKQHRIEVKRVTFIAKRSVVRDVANRWLHITRTNRASRKQSQESLLAKQIDSRIPLTPESGTEKDQSKPIISTRVTRASVKKASTKNGESISKDQVSSKRDRSPDQTEASGESSHVHKRLKSRTWPIKVAASGSSLG